MTSNSARPKYTMKAEECRICGKRDKVLTITKECRGCNPTKFYREYPAQKMTFK